ncbi:hypothetical protein DY000_02040848 [Brassica cretica]|uniref:Uncharacterized protein n=1 Tax=Brassica cretica TaxID=69181 RepID=A0ABQ7BGK8_BRACR|nr:hypothetical protein DY000_02040848 [Brassica cretica]
MSKRLERNGSRNQTRSPARSFGPFEHTVQLGGCPSWIEQATSSAIRRAGPVQFGGQPSGIEHATSSAINRAGPVQFGGWPSRIEQATSSSDQLKRPARPSAEVDRTRDQLGHPPSWTSSVWGMAELKRLCYLHPVLAAPPFGIRSNLLLFHLDRSHPEVTKRRCDRPSSSNAPPPVFDRHPWPREREGEPIETWENYADPNEDARHKDCTHRVIENGWDDYDSMFYNEWLKVTIEPMSFIDWATIRQLGLRKT